MLSEKNSYNTNLPEMKAMEKISSKEITKLLEVYLEGYTGCFVRSQQAKYFKAFERGLLSNLDRKSIEPIALSFLGEKEVRGMQQFFTRSKGWDESLQKQYKEKLAAQISEDEGFLSVDECDFPKKGKESAGVARQYCGRMGKTENCQAGVFISYASKRGMGLVDSRLYLPKIWFGDDYKEKREDCLIPNETVFKTKNEMAKEMISQAIESRRFEIECVGCDASFGSDHTFLDSLPETMSYFATVRENENIFREMPQVVVPENAGKGGKYKHPRAIEQPMAIKTIISDETVPWIKRAVSTGTKGIIHAEVKCLRCVSSRKKNRLFMPGSEIWVYIRKHEDGKIKYFISNMPANTDISELDRLATSRWSIEQCFQECKSYLGMSHYETRSYQAWHRHMLLVMIAQLFVTVLRDFLKKTPSHCHNADGSLFDCLADSNTNKNDSSLEHYSLSFAA